MHMNMAIAKPQPRRNQAKKPKGFTLWAKSALVRHGLSITELAGKLGKTRGSVSLAINHPSVLPGVVELIKKALSQEEAA